MATAPGAEVLERVPTPRGELVLQRRGEAYEVVFNGCFLVATHEGGASERALVTLGLRHGREANGPGWLPRRVLVGGLGAGYTLRAALDAPGVEHVTVVEIEPAVARWNRSHLASVNGRSLDDPRVRLVLADLAALLIRPPGRPYDLIALDTDNGPDWTVFEANQALWSPEGVGRLRRWLEPGGVLACWAHRPVPAFAARLRREFTGVQLHRVSGAAIYLATPAPPGDQASPGNGR